MDGFTKVSEAGYIQRSTLAAEYSIIFRSLYELGNKRNFNTVLAIGIIDM